LRKQLLSEQENHEGEKEHSDSMFRDDMAGLPECQTRLPSIVFDRVVDRAIKSSVAGRPPEVFGLSI
jgi:hypothetical protein